MERLDMSEEYKISNKRVDQFKAAVIRVAEMPREELDCEDDDQIPPPAKELLALFPPVTVMAEGVWPPPTWQGWVETPITPEMIAAGLAAMSDDPMVTDRYDAERLYRAMDAHRPVEFISDATILMRDTIEAIRALNTTLHDELKARTDERDAALALIEANTDVFEMMDDQRLALEARIRELDDLLAQRPAPVPDTPKPVHDFTRVEGGDRRMLGR
jgi:hypothetical protein